MKYVDYKSNSLLLNKLHALSVSTEDIDCIADAVKNGEKVFFVSANKQIVNLLSDLFVRESLISVKNQANIDDFLKNNSYSIACIHANNIPVVQRVFKLPKNSFFVFVDTIYSNGLLLPKFNFQKK